MRTLFSAILSFFLFATAGAAQDRYWVQIEAQPTLRQAQEAARGYAAALPDVNGFRLGSRWYGVFLGPYSADTADSTLRSLRRRGAIPRDSYVVDDGPLGQRFWPVGGAALSQVPPALPETATPTAETTAEETETAPVIIIEDTTPPEETLAQARRSEAQLSRDEKRLLQEALQWEGFYTAAIDGAFGGGTRRAMSDWQAAQGHEPTGVLTTRQREELVTGYQQTFAALGLGNLDEVEAGIRITLPLTLVEFDHYEPPFVHFKSRDDSGLKVLLISQEGDQSTLFGLYDIMQTLAIVPLEGARSRERDSFVLTGQSADLNSYTYAALADGMVKGFTLAWRPGDEKLMTRVVQIMRDSFEPYGGALDEALMAPGVDQSIDLMSGLEIRRPEVSRTGFFVDATGAVLTTDEVVSGQCTRLTIGNDETEVEIAARDAALGAVLLRPTTALAPLGVARFAATAPRLQSEIAVAGFSYEGVLEAPVLTYGQLADVKGLDGDTSRARLTLAAQPGDAGGPVLDVSGAVLGMLLAPVAGARQLPADVRFAASAEALAAFLAANAIRPAPADAAATLDPVDLSLRASDLTVLVSCWN